jgi:hypothetical protein
MACFVAALEILHLAGAAIVDPTGEPCSLFFVFGGAGLGDRGDPRGGETCLASQLVDTD